MPTAIICSRIWCLAITIWYSQSPEGYSFSPANQGSDDNLDSDPAVNGRTPTTTLLSGENDLTWWAGLNRKSSLGDYVWEDSNANGLQDPGEPGVPDVTVSFA